MELLKRAFIRGFRGALEGGTGIPGLRRALLKKLVKQNKDCFLEYVLEHPELQQMLLEDEYGIPRVANFK